MANPAHGLAERNQLTVILRLVLDKQGKLVHGELVDTEGQPHGRFSNWEGLGEAVQGWMHSEEPAS